MSQAPRRGPTAAALASSAAIACLLGCGVDWTVPAARTGTDGSSDGGGGAASDAPASSTGSSEVTTSSADGGASQGVTTTVTTGGDGQGGDKGEGANGSGETVTTGGGDTVTTGGGNGCGGGGCEDCQSCAIDDGGPCREAFESCEGHESCAPLMACAAECPPDEEACINGCFEEFPEGADKADFLMGCVLCEVCADACGPSPRC